IVSNPPFHQGKAIDYAMPERLIREAPRHLHQGGSVLIVANAFLSYRREMERSFRNVEIVTATRQYHVVKATTPR
ncbi:MAG: methyltransferase, partial [Thermomicrobiales bacterium]